MIFGILVLFLVLFFLFCLQSKHVSWFAYSFVHSQMSRIIRETQKTLNWQLAVYIHRVHLHIVQHKIRHHKIRVCLDSRRTVALAISSIPLLELGISKWIDPRISHNHLMFYDFFSPDFCSVERHTSNGANMMQQ